MKLSADPAALRETYGRAAPFPHIVLEDLFPRTVLEDVLEDFPGSEAIDWIRFNDPRQKKLASRAEVGVTDRTLRFLHFLNSAPMIEFLEKMTGIKGLIPDPHYEGGGLHQIPRGGFLKVHADFNWHYRLGLHRRINMLIYLNKDWKEEYGGHLELWDRDMKTCRQRVLPVFGRVVVFNTTDFAFHGHPEPLTCPEGSSRKSIALYYYSSTRPRHELSNAHWTLFKRRQGEAFTETLRERLMQRYLPPALVDWARRRKHSG